MRKKIFLIFMVALSLAACHNVNPPSSEQSAGIIDVCNNSIGKSPDVFINGLKELGLEAKLVHFDRQKEGESCYEVEKENYIVSCCAVNDTIESCGYATDFHASFAEGWNSCKEFSNKISSFEWDSWKGEGYNDINEHEEYIIKTEEYVNNFTGASLGVYELFEKASFGKFIFCTLDYSAYSTGGVNPNTGKGYTKMADCHIEVSYTLRNESSIK